MDMHIKNIMIVGVGGLRTAANVLGLRTGALPSCGRAGQYSIG